MTEVEKVFAALSPGDRVREIGTDGTLWHIRGRVDDRIVMRFWSRSKCRWRYKVEDITAFIVGLYVVKGKPARQRFRESIDAIRTKARGR